jgi:predicted small secreted protein
MKTLPRHLSLVCTLLMAAVLLLAASGCKNTAKGVGKDMERAGEKIQEKVD